MNALIIADKIDDINFDLLYKGCNYNGLRGGAIIRMNQCPREGRRPPGNQGAGAGSAPTPGLISLCEESARLLLHGAFVCAILTM